MRIAAWNINRSALTADHRHLLRKLEPTVCVLSEVRGPEFFETRDRADLCRESGIALLVTEGFLHRSVTFDATPHFRTWDWILANGQSISISGVHVRKSPYTAGAIEGMSALTRRTGLPMIVAGDFNVNIDYSSSRFAEFTDLLRQLGLRSAWHVSNSAGQFGGEPPTCTRRIVRNGKSLRNYMIDYVFVSEAFSLHTAGIDEMGGMSDHKAVFASATLPVLEKP